MTADEHDAGPPGEAPKPPRPLTARGLKTRQKLLDRAEEVFGEKGYERAAISEITLRAGVAQGTFYVYFPDKQAIFTELVKELSHLLRQEIATAVEGVDDRLEAERVGFRTFFDFSLRHRNLYRVVRQAEFVDESLYRWYYMRMADGYIKGLSAAMERGQIRRTDPETLAWCLMAISDFMGMRWVLWEGQQPPDRTFDEVMEIVSRALTPDR